MSLQTKQIMTLCLLAYVLPAPLLIHGNQWVKVLHLAYYACVVHSRLTDYWSDISKLFRHRWIKRAALRIQTRREANVPVCKTVLQTQSVSSLTNYEVI